MDEWEVLGFEEFKGKVYLKMQRKNRSTFGKNFANLSGEQVRAILLGVSLDDLAKFANLTGEEIAG